MLRWNRKVSKVFYLEFFWKEETVQEKRGTKISFVVVNPRTSGNLDPSWMQTPFHTGRHRFRDYQKKNRPRQHAYFSVSFLPFFRRFKSFKKLELCSDRFVSFFGCASILEKSYCFFLWPFPYTLQSSSMSYHDMYAMPCIHTCLYIFPLRK